MQLSPALIVFELVYHFIAFIFPFFLFLFFLLELCLVLHRSVIRFDYLPVFFGSWNFLGRNKASSPSSKKEGSKKVEKERKLFYIKLR